MQSVLTFLRVEMVVLLLASAGVVLLLLLIGRISMHGLLSDKLLGRSMSPDRVVLLVGSLSAAVVYVVQVLRQGQTTPPRLPSPGTFWILILGASNALYLGAKSIGLVRLIRLRESGRRGPA